MALSLLAPFSIPPTAKAVTFNMPDQASCDNGSTTLTWAGEDVARPQVASMTVDGETIADPANPELNSLGVVVCPGTTKGNRTGVTVIWHTAGGNTSDLSEALTPLGTAVTTSTQIALTMSNLGDNAAKFTFTLVYGGVTAWTTANLGTASASLSTTLTPTRTPHGSGDDFGGCTAVPPTCTALKSDEDVLGVSMALSFEAGVGTQMAGSYFALTGAMGGYVTSVTNADGTKSLAASIGAPHFLADGATLNTGSMVAFLPTATVNSLFGLTSDVLDTTTMDVIRTSGSTTTSAVPFTIAAVAGGVTLTVPTITFSSPKYTVKMTAAGLAKKKLIAKTASPSKSTVRILGSNIKANGKATYRVEIRVRNRLGGLLTYKPVITSTPTVTVSKGTNKAGTWTFTLSTRTKGQKTVKIKANGMTLKTAKVTYVK